MYACMCYLFSCNSSCAISHTCTDILMHLKFIFDLCVRLVAMLPSACFCSGRHVHARTRFVEQESRPWITSATAGASVCSMTLTATCMQLTSDAMLHYAWDASISANTGSAARMDLFPEGALALASRDDCVDGACIEIKNGQFFLVPAYNFGQFAGLSVSMWLKPACAALDSCFVMDLGNATAGITIAALAQNSSRVRVEVRRPGVAEASYYMVADSVVLESVWTHLVWTIAPKTAAKDAATFKVYLNGSLEATVDGHFPLDALTTTGYVGRRWDKSGRFAGHLDSLMFFPAELSQADVLLVYKVRRLAAQ